QALRIEKASAITYQQNSVGINLRHRKITARRNRLGAVTNHLAAFEQFAEKRMCFETLKLGVRVQQWVLVIETGHVADIQNPILHPVNPAAAVRLRVGRKPKRVRHAPGWITIIRQFPKLFYADAVNLRL